MQKQYNGEYALSLPDDDPAKAGNPPFAETGDGALFAAQGPSGLYRVRSIHQLKLATQVSAWLKN
jgi:hypothetical protein